MTTTIRSTTKTTLTLDACQQLVRDLSEHRLQRDPAAPFIQIPRTERQPRHNHKFRTLSPATLHVPPMERTCDNFDIAAERLSLSREDYLQQLNDHRRARQTKPRQSLTDDDIASHWQHERMQMSGR